MKLFSFLCGTFFILFSFIFCTSPQSVVTEAPTALMLKAPVLRPQQQASHPLFIVASDAPLAAQSAQNIYQQGGNIIDAVVAASLVTGVEHPSSTGIGGGGFLLYYSQREKKTYAFDFRERAPAAATKNMFMQGERVESQKALKGGLAVAVPGLIAGLYHIHQRFGKLKWSQLLVPAIRLADTGLKVDKHLAEVITRYNLEQMPTSDFKNLISAQGKALQEGDLFIQKNLAETLKIIGTQGAAGFYEGKIAEAIVKSVQQAGGIITLQDLKNYQVIERTALQLEWDKYTLMFMPPPSSGGVLLMQILKMLQPELQKLATRPQKISADSADFYHLLIETMKRSYRDRADYLGDPDFVQVPIQELTADNYLKELMAHFYLEKRTDWTLINSQLRSQIPKAPPVHKESYNTTHISLMDAEGNMVSTTQSINYAFGSEVIAENTGILLNDEMDDFTINPIVANVYGLMGSEANSIAPNKTPLSSMTPTLVFCQQKACGSLGAPGGSHIISTILQNFLHTFYFHLDPQVSTLLPRVHHQYQPDEVMLEPYEPATALKTELEKRGHIVKLNKSFAKISLLYKNTKQQLKYLNGYTDPRGYGAVAGF